MNILFLTLSQMDSLSNRNIYIDLMREFIRNNHKVYIVSPTERKNNEKTRIINEISCNILKVRIGNIQKTNIIEKGISTILIENQFTNAIKKYFSNVKFDLILYSTPPITLEKVVNFIKKRDGAKSYLLLKDIFPQNAVDIKMLSKRGLLYRYFRNKEKKMYQLSDYIGCMSQANVEYILKNNSYLDKVKVHVAPNSIEPINIIKDDAIKTKIRKKYDIPSDVIVFIYGGNLGKPQGINFFINCLKTQIKNEKAFFLVVGSGTEYIKLKKYQNEIKQNNFKLIPFLPKKDYDVVLNFCDVGMIFLDKRFTIPNFPSRILAYMESYMPVFACTDVNTDIRDVIVQGEFGYWCESSDPNEFKKMIDKICRDPVSIKKMGENARMYLEKYYTINQTYDIIMKHIK